MIRKRTGSKGQQHHDFWRKGQNSESEAQTRNARAGTEQTEEGLRQLSILNNDSSQETCGFLRICLLFIINYTTLMALERKFLAKTFKGYAACLIQ